MKSAAIAPRRGAQGIRRPRAERLHNLAVETIGNVSMTAELFSAMTSDVSPDTLRRMEQAEVLERAILGLLRARATP